MQPGVLIAARIGLRLVIGGTLIAAPLAKSLTGTDGVGQQRSVFESFVHNRPGLRLVFLVAEALLGLWVVSGMRLRVSAMLAAALFSFFTGLLIVEAMRERPRPCGCFGTTATVAPPEVLRRQLASRAAMSGLLMIGGAILVVTSPSRASRTTAMSLASSLHGTAS